MNDDPAGLRRRTRRTLFAWAALVALLFASLGSAYVPLGPWNVVVGLAVAAAKSAIVLVLFMGLGRAGALLRMVAAAGAFTLALLFALTEVDYATRVTVPAAMQAPQQLEPLAGKG